MNSCGLFRKSFRNSFRNTNRYFFSRIPLEILDNCSSLKILLKIPVLTFHPEFNSGVHLKKSTKNPPDIGAFIYIFLNVHFKGKSTP